MINKDQLSQSIVDVMKHYGLGVSASELHVSRDDETTSIERLKSLSARDLRRHGFLGEWRDITVEKIPRLAFPAVLAMKNGDILLLHDVYDGSARVSSPAAPDMVETFSTTEVEEAYAGSALLIKLENTARMMNPGDYPKEKTSWLIAPILRNLSVYRDVFTVALVANLLAAGIALYHLSRRTT